MDVEPSFFGKAIESLERSSWGEPDYGSYVVTTVHALRKKPLRSLSDEELRLALSQQVGLPWTIELAIRRLEEDPLRSGDFYPGDVLAMAIRLPKAIWSSQPALKARLEAVVVALQDKIDGSDRDDLLVIKEVLAGYSLP